MSIASVAIGGGIEFANDRPFVLIGGMNVIENEDTVFAVADRFLQVTGQLGIPYAFKASFDKANRTSVDAYRGPGLKEGLRILAGVKAAGFPILTDIHDASQADRQRAHAR